MMKPEAMQGCVCVERQAMDAHGGAHQRQKDLTQGCAGRINGVMMKTSIRKVGLLK